MACSKELVLQTYWAADSQPLDNLLKFMGLRKKNRAPWSEQGLESDHRELVSSQADKTASHSGIGRVVHGYVLSEMGHTNDNHHS